MQLAALGSHQQQGNGLFFRRGQPGSQAAVANKTVILWRHLARRKPSFVHHPPRRRYELTDDMAGLDREDAEFGASADA
jgi:hypothetical protein